MWFFLYKQFTKQNKTKNQILSTPALQTWKIKYSREQKWKQSHEHRTNRHKPLISENKNEDKYIPLVEDTLTHPKSFMDIGIVAVSILPFKLTITHCKVIKKAWNDYVDASYITKK